MAFIITIAMLHLGNNLAVPSVFFGGTWWKSYSLYSGVQDAMGAMLGITTEHASRTVAELKRQDAIFEMSPNRYRCDLDQLECIGADDC